MYEGKKQLVVLEEMKVHGGRSTTKEENTEDERGREQIIQGITGRVKDFGFAKDIAVIENFEAEK